MQQLPTAELVAMISRRLHTILGEKLLAVYWFGSRSRGQGDESSDIDLLLETRSPVSETERDATADLAIDLAADYSVVPDIHYYTRQQLHHAKQDHGQTEALRQCAWPQVGQQASHQHQIEADTHGDEGMIDAQRDQLGHEWGLRRR